MRLLFDPIFLQHDTGAHPENRGRLEVFDNVTAIQAPDASDLLHLVHTPDHIERVRNAWPKIGRLDSDTVISEHSYQVACQSVGLTVEASESGDFALVRPPGHHAYADHGSGFCLFNNIAIACQRLVQDGKRVLIFDFDGHHGDGTAAIFYNSDRVLYWSTHQYPAFPGYGSVDEIGRGQGEGFTVNVPLPPGSGDDLLMDSFRRFLPIAKQFDPDIVAISAGFDGHTMDPLLQLNFTTSIFHTIGTELRNTFSNIFAVLEGGYNPPVLKSCVENFVAGINGREQSAAETPGTSSEMVKNEYERRVEGLILNLKPYWSF